MTNALVLAARVGLLLPLWPVQPPCGVAADRWALIQAVAARRAGGGFDSMSWRGRAAAALTASSMPRHIQRAKGRLLALERLLEATGARPAELVSEVVATPRTDRVVVMLGQRIKPVTRGHLTRDFHAVRAGVGWPLEVARIARPAAGEGRRALEAIVRSASEGVAEDASRILNWLDCPYVRAYPDRRALARVRIHALRHGMPKVRLCELWAERTAHLGTSPLPAVQALAGVRSGRWPAGMRWPVPEGWWTSRLDPDGIIPGPVLTVREETGTTVGKTSRMSASAMRAAIADANSGLRQHAERLGEELESQLIAPRFHTLPSHAWETIGPFVSEVMRRAQFRGPEVFAKRLRVMAALAWWACEHGYDLTIEDVLAERTIETWFRTGMPTVNEQTRATRRSHARSIARAVNPGNEAPVATGRVPKKDIRPPYSAAEVEQLMWWLDRIGDARLKAKAVAAVCLGFGAGLDAVDVRSLKFTDIEDVGEAGILVTVPEPRPRSVWVLRSFEARLRTVLPLLADRGPVVSMSGRSTPNTISVLYLQATSKAGCPVPLEQARMRATWLVTLMNVPVPLNVLLAAAGLQTPRTLVDLLPHAETYGTDHVAAFLRGAAW